MFIFIKDELKNEYDKRILQTEDHYKGILSEKA